MEHYARRAITTIRENYHEPLVLDDLARSVMMSKFYFIRVFQRTTGVTPGRFLSAVRLHEAKSLLVHSSSNVADVSARVGYGSASTFSRRFTASVGLSPTQYRRIGRGGTGEDPHITPFAVERGPLGSVAGTARVLGSSRSPLYIGLFDSPILQGQPAAWTKLDGSGPFQVADVPPGTWYLHAVTLGARTSGDQWGDSPLLVGTVGPVDIGADERTRVDVVLQQEDWTRPPVLLALPGFGSRPARPHTAETARPAGPYGGPGAGYRTPRQRTAADRRLVGV
ncbi:MULTISPECIES: helix-turn-helix domain-containing protein [unclassified Streptomyces]|uniref:helix-turn-helix domain-containing protein n=1 Tax=unclassified Streptomyces TaxID=2593676 RepID=UPI002E15CDD4|nr:MULTISPECIES: helix-turn-helix domain-containing protein [unclassified Streptomyces]WSR21639.1 AraC family transcriptional regulator [Streptomyces sp. NBC_01205]